MIDPLDYYPTPSWVAEIAPIAPSIRSVLDPCAGTGSLLSVLLRRGFEVRGIEIDRGRALTASEVLGVEIVCGDALRIPWPKADAVVMNPPFSIAPAFVRRAMECSPVVVSLLPLNWLEPCEDRLDLLLLHPNVDVLPSRPRFLGRGRGSASTTCAWFSWPGLGVLSYLRRPDKPSQRELFQEV